MPDTSSSTGRSDPDRVRVRTEQEFEHRIKPLRREIKVHCYRMLGSVHEAEDLLQETLLRAWRAFDRFEEGGSFRAWLYRIATNACLNALEARKSAQRLLPDQVGPASTPAQLGSPNREVAWLEPLPDSDLVEGIADEAPTPEARVATRQAVRLAFIAAIQELPPRQRAALLLCDVLGWTASEAASLLSGTTASINSALQRARETLDKRFPHGLAPAAAPPDPVEQQLLERYVRAWESHDAELFAALLKEDVTVNMPPWPQWFVGREPVRSFFAQAWKSCGGLRLVRTSANGQPAFAAYEKQGPDGPWAANAIHVLAIDSGSIATLTLFVEPRLFPHFGLSPTLRPGNAPYRSLGH